MAVALWAVVAVLCFHAAYSFGPVAVTQWLIAGYVIGLGQVARVKSGRQAFYLGLLTGFVCFAPQLTFFWTLFKGGAVVLWLILASWVALFVILLRMTLVRWGTNVAAVVLPFLWTGLEYFRSELYYLRFSWLNLGYALSGWEENLLPLFGMYGVGFLLASIASIWLVVRSRWMALLVTSLALTLLRWAIPTSDIPTSATELHLAGLQMEFPSENEILPALETLRAADPDLQIAVLSEYTLDGPVPDSVKSWCRESGCYLVVGGKELARSETYFNTAFVVGPTGEIIFQQAKSVPIPFFNDGLAARQQAVWPSPWGRIGICICFDLSFTRVTDELIRQGAQLVIVPTMDVIDWGGQEHISNARVAPVRAAEYGVPIFRLGSSGISEAVDVHGRVLASAAFPGQGEMLSARLQLPAKGTRPLDRWLGPFSVAVVVLVVMAHAVTWVIYRRRRRPAAK